ncbi:MAG: sugar transporter [Yoonia sp.]|uniref:sugar transporter n=1 Tax=Yoonia sp. TaxID=2212373 RepID=UPI003EF4FBC8
MTDGDPAPKRTTQNQSASDDTRPGAKPEKAAKDVVAKDSDVAKKGSESAKAFPSSTDAKPQKPEANPLAAKRPQRPVARPAGMRRRHWGLVLSFLLLVAVPLTATGFYLWSIAKDQYGSVAGFTVRSDEGSSASELLGGLAQLTGTSSSADGDILYEFILSQALVRSVDEQLDLRGHYSAHWEDDPVFALWPDSSIEALEWYWGRIVQVSFDQGTGLVELRILAFSPEMAQDIAQTIVSESQEMINALNSQAREDGMRYAVQDLETAVEQLKAARQALTDFRTRTQIVDPATDIQGRLGVMNNLQQQLAEALIELDLLASNTGNANDPRALQAATRVDVIQNRIEQERTSFATGNGDNGTLSENYPALIAEFEGLTVDREYAEESYRATLTALTVTRAQSARQSRYLALYIQPTLAETSEFPRRYSIFGFAALFLLLSWAVLALIYYSVRDRG